MTDWQIIGIGVAIGVPSFLFLIQRWIQRKELSYDIFSSTPLLNLQGENKWDLQILFDKKPVQDVDLIQIEIFNSGHQEIRPNDYEYPISFNFGGNTQILSAEKSEVYPESLQPSIRVEGTKVVLDPILLNPKDSIIIKILASRFESKLTPNVRIAGIKDIKDARRNIKNQAVFKAISGLIVGILGLFALFRISPPEATIFLVFFTFFLIYSILGFLYMWKGISSYTEMKKNR